MFKKLALFMSLLALLGLAACSRPGKEAPKPEELDPKEPLTICFDLDPSFDPRHFDFDSGQAKYTGAKLRQEAVDGFLEELAAVGGPRNVQVEFLEDLGSDREGQLTRLRAELMAGEGPDLFVLRQNGASDLFLFPEKKMEDGLFLCLDGYMERARFMEPDKMLTPVFDAGKSSEGRRFLLPVTYDIDAALMRSSYLHTDPEQKLTLSDLLDPEGPLGSTLSLWHNKEFDECFTGIYPALGQLADYKAESLNFSKEELEEFFSELLEYERRVHSGEIASPSGVFTGDIAHANADLASRQWAMEPVTMVPLYDKDGGVTARVDVFAGVNANAKNPAGAFFAADLLLDREYMQDSDIHMYLWSNALPVYTDLFGPDTTAPYIREAFSGGGDLRDGLQGSCWEAFGELLEEITGAEFPTRLDTEISRGYYAYFSAESDAARQKAVSDAYTTMSMLLGES